MSEQPLSPAEAQEAARVITEGQAAGVAGQDVAGIYGDPAGRSQHSAPQSQEQVAADLAAKGGQAFSVDVEALAKSIEAGIMARLGLADAAPPAPPDTKLSRHVDGNAPGWAHNLVANVEERLAAIESKLGL